jgi:DNA (cytosine-5)-methyltransferase 1
MLQVRDQMAQLAAENGLKVSDAIANQLMPTPSLNHIRNYDEPVEDYLARRQKMEDGEYKGMPGVSLGVALRMEMLPTPVAIEGIKGTAAQGSEEKSKTGQVWLTNIAHDFATEQGLPTPPRQNGLPQPEPKEAAPLSWGKFEPAIRRWEAVLGRPAPAPTKPDGKDGAHRLSSALTEWMMGLPAGWVTDVGLSRVDELKACGNGVVPQQAELALRILLEGVDLSDKVEQVNLPTPTVSDVYTADLASSQMSDDSMHSVSLPRAINRLIK